MYDVVSSLHVHLKSNDVMYIVRVYIGNPMDMVYSLSSLY